MANRLVYESPAAYRRQAGFLLKESVDKVRPLMGVVTWDHQGRREKKMVRVSLTGVCLGFSLLAGQSFGGPEPMPISPSAGPALQCLEQLAALPWCELEQLYRKSPAGSIPDGFACGKVVYCPAEPFAGPRAHFAGMIWKGKHFCSAQGTLVNQWLGIAAIRARVSYGPSWLDGAEAIILDYCGESRVWADVRDEMREVAPGLYLGAMVLRRCPQPKLKLFFCLQANSCAH